MKRPLWLSNVPALFLLLHPFYHPQLRDANPLSPLGPPLTPDPNVRLVLKPVLQAFSFLRFPLASSPKINCRSLCFSLPSKLQSVIGNIDNFHVDCGFHVCPYCSIRSLSLLRRVNSKLLPLFKIECTAEPTCSPPQFLSAIDHA